MPGVVEKAKVATIVGEKRPTTIGRVEELMGIGSPEAPFSKGGGHDVPSQTQETFQSKGHVLVRIKRRHSKPRD